MEGGPLSDVRNMLCVIVGVKTGRKRPRRKAEQTEVVEGDRLVRENQNLVVSCTGFVHAWPGSSSRASLVVPFSVAVEAFDIFALVLALLFGSEGLILGLALALAQEALLVFVGRDSDDGGGGNIGVGDVTGGGKCIDGGVVGGGQ